MLLISLNYIINLVKKEISGLSGKIKKILMGFQLLRPKQICYTMICSGLDIVLSHASSFLLIKLCKFLLIEVCNGLHRTFHEIESYKLMKRDVKLKMMKSHKICIRK